MSRRFWAMVMLGLMLAASARAEVCNVKVVTDASPDYSDMPSLVRSITSKWETPAEKCWAVFYWNHIARRQTSPIELHGMALTDPIRQFNDYGYTMCSTISGINQSIWEHMGLKHKYWDIANHTVCEVFYNGRWHMYDNSMSAIYTLCDGKTIAGVEDIGKAGACAASEGKVEPGHVAKYHCLNATSPRGFLTGADCARSLDEEYRCFNPNALKYRSYFYDWDYGHRYILNLKEGETYTRYYHSLGDTPAYYVPNGAKDPESVSNRYRIRGNGVWVFEPSLENAKYRSALHSATNIVATAPVGLRPERPDTPAEVIYKVHSANVVTSQVIEATFDCDNERDTASLSISTTNGLHWTPIWQTSSTGQVTAKVNLLEEVNSAYEVLVKVHLSGQCVLRGITITTTTNLNSKTQPRLNLGKNTIYVGTGEATESIVFWPDLQGSKYKQQIVEEKNISSSPKHSGWRGVVFPSKPKEDGYLVYRIDAPGEIARLTYGGRFSNRAPNSHIDLLHSFDAGKTWVKSWTLSSTEMPWDVIHYETVNVPTGCNAVWAKYQLYSPDASPTGAAIYALRMEANYKLADASFKSMEVTFTWRESQKDRSLVQRSHTQRVDKVPFRYVINVGGEDQPIMESLAVNLQGARGVVKPGYSDGKDVGGEKHVGRWVTYGKNLAAGKPYTVSIPSEANWGAGDPQGKKLTDGVKGPPYAGGISYQYGLVWNDKKNPIITVDLGAPAVCASFGMDFHGYPWWDVMKGEVKDKVQVLVSEDGQAYRPVGYLHTDWRWKELPVNHMWPDDETITGATFRLVPEKPVTARYVQYKVENARIFCATELEVLESIRQEPFDLRIALPSE
ncbi:MAG TPA: hypothetical protein VHP11_06085 [Tepidisphaeraceae bacterium]|nr:hypothetical protein [Tepidisphaeraceae bacterium]